MVMSQHVLYSTCYLPGQQELNAYQCETKYARSISNSPCGLSLTISISLKCVLCFTLVCVQFLLAWQIASTIKDMLRYDRQLVILYMLFNFECVSLHNLGWKYRLKHTISLQWFRLFLCTLMVSEEFYTASNPPYRYLMVPESFQAVAR